MDDININQRIDVINEWSTEFTKQIKRQSNSKKVNYTFSDALVNKALHSKRDECFIIAYTYLKENLPERNDFIKYLTAYIEDGIKLKQEYFKYDYEILNKYYNKVDEKKKNGDSYNPFNIKSYRNYVVFMILKLHGVYESTDDELFRVSKKDNREFNPATNIPSVLRGFLPIRIKELDVKREFPTIIDEELGTNFRHDIYEILDKVTFAKVLNANSVDPNDYYYTECINELKKVYGDKAYEVLTFDRFYEKGKVYRDFVKREKEVVEQCAEVNDVINYVRLHDALIVRYYQNIKQTKFGLFEFDCKEITALVVNSDIKETFYYLSDDGEFKITPTRIRDFFLNIGMKRIATADDQILLLKDTNNVIEYYNHKTDLLTLLKLGINEIKGEYAKVEDLLSHEYKNIIAKALPLIIPKKLIFYQDSQYTFGLPFKNGFMLMDKNGVIEKQDYNSVKGFFNKHIIQERVFTQTDEVGDYERLVKNVSGKDEKAFMSMIGFLAHSYKNPTMSPCIILTDDHADDINRKGGRGKSIFGAALSEVLIQILKGGNEFNPNYTHNFADLEKGTRLYIIDDVIAGFKYDDLYTNILGDISCQRKGKKAEQIKFEETPKFLITSNWVIPHSTVNNSTNRRFVEFKFNDHYNKDNTPFTEFGRRLFLDWDEVEFNRFYSYIFRCVKLFFDNGLIKPIYDKEADNYSVKFRNEAFETEFERILKPMLVSKTTFKVSDFLKKYKDVENPFKNENWFHQNNVRDLIDIWLKHSNNAVNYKYWSYSKSHKAWFYNDTNLTVKSILDC